MASGLKGIGISRWVTSADVRMAMRNVFRQRGRTMLTLSIIGAGVAGLIVSGGFVEDALKTLRESTIHAQLGHLQVYRAGYYEEGKRSPYRYLIGKPAEISDIASGDPAVAQTMARLSFAGILNNGRSDYAILGEGIDDYARQELSVLDEKGLLRPETMIIHATAFGPPEFARIAKAGAKVIW
jgi:ABC-type lipoprotein release transport system permease subunit